MGLGIGCRGPPAMVLLQALERVLIPSTWSGVCGFVRVRVRVRARDRDKVWAKARVRAWAS